MDNEASIDEHDGEGVNEEQKSEEEAVGWGNLSLRKKQNSSLFIQIMNRLVVEYFEI